MLKNTYIKLSNHSSFLKNSFNEKEKNLKEEYDFMKSSNYLVLKLNLIIVEGEMRGL